MHEHSTLIIQTSQADMCKNREFDTIYHEHINFFNVKSMLKLTKRAKLKLHNVDLNPLCRCVYGTHSDRRGLESTVDASSAHVVAARGGRFARR